MSKKLTGRHFKEFIVSTIMIIIGCSIYGFAMNFFIKPNGLGSGGFSGIGLILNYEFGWSIGTFFIIANIPLLIVGFILWKWPFLEKTLIGVLASSVLVDLMSGLTYTVDNQLLAAIYGGLFYGVGIGIVIRFGGTTGGTDILAKIVNKFTGLSMGTFYLIFDTCVIATCALIYGLETALNSMFVVFISSKVVDVVVDGFDKGKKAIIITSMQEETVNFIRDNMHRGCTILDAKGGYKYEEHTLILCTVKRQEIFRLKKGILLIDPHAFMIISDAHEVYGLGFRSMEGQ